MRYRRLRSALAAVSALLLATCVPAIAEASTQCQGSDIAVGTGQTMHGTLCQPVGATTVMVLVPGATYNHTYWDFPYNSTTYNFRMAMNAANYATFVVDRLGTGQSSRPLSATVTATVQADAVHHVIQALRTGQVGGVAFSKVILGGHSLGSWISVIEAVAYNDEDAVMLTGFTHTLKLTWVTNFFTNSAYPAAGDPKFQGQGYDSGYFTTRLGTRGADFYAPETTDPNVLDTDERTKDVASYTEAPDGVGFGSAGTANIAHPVMVAVGGEDQAFCTGQCSNTSALAAEEAPYYSAAAKLQTYIQPQAGHDLNLATNTQQYQQAMIGWANSVVGP